MGTLSSPASSSSRLWSGTLELNGLVLPGFALYKRSPPTSSASTSAKGKQKATPVVLAGPARTMRSRASATGLPTPPSTAAGLGPSSLTSSPERELLVVGGGSEPSPPVRRPTRRVSALKPASSSTSGAPSPATAAPATTATATGPTIRRIKLTSTLFPQPSLEDDLTAILADALAAEGAQLVVDTVLPVADLESCDIELPCIELDFADGFELCNTGPSAEWPYDNSPAGCLHEKLETAIYNGHTQRFAIVTVRSSKGLPSSERVTLAVYGWGGPLETREMRLFAIVLNSKARSRLQPSTISGQFLSLVVEQKSESSGSILGDPDEELVLPRPHPTAAAEALQTNDSADLSQPVAIKLEDHRKATVSHRSSTVAQEPRSGSSHAIDPPHPPSSSDDASAANDPAPLPPRSKRPRPNDRNRPLKDRLANNVAHESAPGCSASGSGPSGARPGVWSKPSTSRRPAKRARKPEADVGPRPKLKILAVESGEEDKGSWETRKRVTKDVRDGGVNSWLAAVVPGCAGLVERPLSPPRATDVASAVASRNLSLLRQCTTMSLLSFDMPRSHPDWRLVHGFIVRGAKFALRHRKTEELLTLADVAATVELHVSAYLPVGLAENCLLRAEAARLREAHCKSALEPVPTSAEVSIEAAVPMDVDPSVIAAADDVQPTPTVAGETVSLPTAPIAIGAAPLVSSYPAAAANEGALEDLASSALVAQPPFVLPTRPATLTAVGDTASPPTTSVPPPKADARSTLAHILNDVSEAPPVILAAVAVRDVFSDGDSDLTSVASEDGEDDNDDAAGEEEEEEEEEEEYINSRPTTPAPSLPVAASPSSPLSVAFLPATVIAAAVKARTPFRRATRSTALLNLALHSSASKADNEAAARTSPSAASSTSVATPPDGMLFRTLLLHGSVDETASSRRSSRRVSSGNKVAPLTVAAGPAPALPSVAVVAVAPPYGSAPLASVPAAVPLAKDFATRRSPRRTPLAASRSLPPSPHSPVKEEEEAADLGAAFERTIGRGGEVVYLLSRRSREGTAASACTI